MFIDELERLVKEEYRDKTEFYSEPSAQGDYTGYDTIQVILPHDIYHVEEDYIFNFSFKFKIDEARKYYTDEYDDEYDEYAYLKSKPARVESCCYFYVQILTNY